MSTAIGLALSLWVIIGFVVVRVRKDGGNWLVMIEDERNCNHTWLVWPALILTCFLWPIRSVERLCFITIWSFGL